MADFETVHDAHDHTGVPGVGGAATPPDSKEAFMSADTAVSGANALTDLTGMSLSLGAGTWLVQAHAIADDSNGGTALVGLALHDGTSVVATSASPKPGGAGERAQPVVAKRITLAGTATVKAQGISTRSTTTFRKSVAGTFGAGAADTACRIGATKVTSA